MDFSRRSNWDRRLNRLAAAEKAREAAGRELIDLTSSNPSECGFRYPAGELAAALASAELETYRPDPKGLLSARRAVASLGFGEAVQIDPEQILLCSGTSDAYAYLLKLLCEPGDNILVPRPSYPLLDYLAGLEGVTLKPYPLHFAGEWSVDCGAVREAIDERSRAVVAINPGNPTGAFLKRAELDALESLCAERGCALLCDEVFSAYPLAAEGDRVGAVLGQRCPALTFALSGLSKAAGLPQMKMAWLCAAGPCGVRDEAMARLELIADTYLASSTVIQSVLPRLLELAPQMRRQIHRRVRENRERICAARPGTARWSVLPAEGGWAAILRLDDECDEEEICLDLLDHGLKVQPGYFFDFPRGKFLVLSLIVPPAAMERGLQTLAGVLSVT